MRQDAGALQLLGMQAIIFFLLAPKKPVFTSAERRLNGIFSASQHCPGLIFMYHSFTLFIYRFV